MLVRNDLGEVIAVTSSLIYCGEVKEGSGGAEQPKDGEDATQNNAPTR